MAFQRLGKLLYSKYLLATNCTWVAIVMASGDAIEQIYVERMQPKVVDKSDESFDANSSGYDLKRTAKMASGGAYIGLCSHYLYRFLDGRWPGRSVRVVVTKAVLDCSIGIPLMAAPVMTYWNFLEGQSLDQNIDSTTTKLPAIIGAEVFFWFPIRLFNFFVLPHHLRVTFNGAVALVYGVFISWIQHQYILYKQTSKQEIISGRAVFDSKR